MIEKLRRLVGTVASRLSGRGLQGWVAGLTVAVVLTGLIAGMIAALSGGSARAAPPSKFCVYEVQFVVPPGPTGQPQCTIIGIGPGSIVCLPCPTDGANCPSFTQCTITVGSGQCTVRVALKKTNCSGCPKSGIKPTGSSCS